MRKRLLSLLFVLCAPIGLRAQEATPTRAFILDTSTKAVTALDVATAKELASVPLQGEPQSLLRTKDGSRLVVLDAGPGKLTVRFGYHPTGKSSLTVIDPASMQPTGRVELGWNLGSVSQSPDGRRLSVLCPGYESQKPQEKLARELVNVDVGAAQVAGRLALEREVHSFLITKDGQTALAFSPRDVPKKGPAFPAELRFIDLKGPSLISTLSLEGSPGGATLAPDGNYVYLLETGQPSKKQEKNINGRIQVVSIATRSVETNLDAGSKPRGLVVDDTAQQVMLLSDGPESKEPGEPSGELRILRGSELVATLKVATRPIFLRVSPDRERLHVVGISALTTVDYPAARVVGQMPLASTGSSVLSAGVLGAAIDPKHHVSELAITPDGKRAFALYGQSSKLLVLDLEARKTIASVTTGRGGVKFAKFMGAVALTAASAYAGQSMATATGSSYYTYNVYGIAPANTSIAVRPDGKFAYVLNTHSNDVTIVNAENGEVVDKIGGGGRRVQILPGGNVVSVVAGSSLGLIDAQSQKELPELPLGGNLYDLVLAPDGRHAVALVDKGVVCLDGSTGKVLARSSAFKRPMQIVFEGETGGDSTR